MENLKEISLSQEIFSCEHLNANKVYFSEKVLDDNRIMPVYHQLCMLLDIYDVKHELKEEKQNDQDGMACQQRLRYVETSRQSCALHRRQQSADDQLRRIRCRVGYSSQSKT